MSVDTRNADTDPVVATDAQRNKHDSYKGSCKYHEISTILETQTEKDDLAPDDNKASS